MKRIGRRAVLVLWSTFRELSWWADNAGPTPKTFVVASRSLGATVIGIGLYLLSAGSPWVGMAMLTVGAGFILGSFELRALRDRALLEVEYRPEDRSLGGEEKRTGWE